MANIVKRFNLKLGKSASQNIPFSGNYVRIVSSDHPVRLETENDRLELDIGDFVRIGKFDNILLTNLSDLTNDVVLIFATENTSFGRDATEITNTVETQQKSGLGIEAKTLDISGEITILPTNEKRLRIVLKNKGTGIINIGSSDVSQNFYELDPNEKLELSRSAADEIRASANNQKLSILAEYEEWQDTAQTPITINGDEVTINGDVIYSY